MIHLSEVAEYDPPEIEALASPDMPSIMADGFPVSIPVKHDDVLSSARSRAEELLRRMVQ